MPGGINLGLNAQLYISDGGSSGYTSGTLVDNCQDLTLKLERNTADVTTRGNNGWRAKVGVLRDATLNFKMIYDIDDTSMISIRDAFMANTSPADQLEVAALDKDGHGLEATVSVTGFTRNEPLEGALTVDVELTPTYDPTHPPQWV